MPYETLIFAYDDAGRASDAIRAIRQLGVPSGDIRRHPVSTDTVEDVAASPEAGDGNGFWAWLFGSDIVQVRIALYKRALDNGGSVVSVRVLADKAARVQAALDRFEPLDITVG